MITISDRAKAISALNNEIESLYKQADTYNEHYVQARLDYIKQIKTLSKQHNILLDKICIMEGSIEKLL